MNWLALLVGAVVGAGTCVLAQNILLPSWTSRRDARKRRAHYRELNEGWRLIDSANSPLLLVQAGWDATGYFPEGTVTLVLGEPFHLDQTLAALRDRNTARWVAELDIRPAESPAECRAILEWIAAEPDDDWAPEAVFCTLRSLLVLERIRLDDVVSALRTGDAKR